MIIIKITSFTDFRTNFELDDLHYSFQQDEDGYDDWCTLRCKETKQEWYFDHNDYSDVIYQFTKPHKYGATYNQMYDINRLEVFVKEIISGIPYKETKAYLEQKEKKRLRDIEYHKEQLRKLGYEI